ncbi:2,3-dihydroxybenzoate-AMP ligase [Corynebacterium pseudopelargi]|uniref:2,3-dihydroxybenzoate-AMP ligase n=2 Tax=Corynebacterium pseudopelargi TaxID=2080757 RepID=A0A3G6IW59_9CORY|nr:AMP-binding protein [Corynebacterium pseudopelargi]AZA10019.1 2,3-dihydroxybenzoate-AMP ligase [Corynebacterium pseudopelargi]
MTHHTTYPQAIPTVAMPAPGSLYPASVEQAYRQAGYWTDETFAEFLDDAASRFGTQEAVVANRLDGQQIRLSYQELNRAAAQRAKQLLNVGIRPGDRVIVQLPNVLEYLIEVFALWRMAAVPVFALPAHRRSEIEHFIRSAGARGLSTCQQHAGFSHQALAAELQRDYPDLIVLLHGDDAGDTTQPPSSTASAGLEAVDLPASHALAMLQVSGGTTGVPKLIPRSHADYLYSVRESAEICKLNTATRFLVALPASHNFTMSSPGILGVLYAGGTVVFCTDPSPSTVGALIEAEAITMTAAVPPLAMAWMNILPALGCDLSSLEVLQVGGAKFTPQAASRVAETLQCQLQQVFGMAEGLVNYTRLDDPHEVCIHTQGRPISPADEVLVVDDHGQEVPAGQRGHLLTRGPYTIRGYLGGVDASSFNEEGFYRTGDIVRRREDGYLVVEGRDKDQIHRGGEKISAEEIEDHLLAHSLVKDAALVAIPDAYLGERSCAFVLVAEDIAGDSSQHRSNAEALRAHLKARGLAAYKIPDDFRFVRQFPVTGVGKISRKQLRRALADTLDASQ